MTVESTVPPCIQLIEKVENLTYSFSLYYINVIFSLQKRNESSTLYTIDRKSRKSHLFFFSLLLMSYSLFRKEMKVPPCIQLMIVRLHKTEITILRQFSIDDRFGKLILFNCSLIVFFSSASSVRFCFSIDRY
uniref:Uncharacterized protein n=1 Tax=Cacopsylla melanoneura TaxID=428564 RepID=A0A8D8ZYA5_9HEMI